MTTFWKINVVEKYYKDHQQANSRHCAQLHHLLKFNSRLLPTVSTSKPEYHSETHQNCFMRILPLLFILVFATSNSLFSQNTPAKPKLIVGIVVDQMRYDFLYRYESKYVSGGFKRLLGEGFSCENTHYNYVPTYTAPGHAAIYTGATPSLSGIIGNE